MLLLLNHVFILAFLQLEISTLGNFKWCLPEGKIQISEFYGKFRPFKNEAKL